MDLRSLPKVRDSWSYLYIEHARIEQSEKSIAVVRKDGKIQIPVACLSLLLLGPGTAITHMAIRTIAEMGCLVVWTGEGGVRFYAQGSGETRSSNALLHQARLVSHPKSRLRVAMAMYRMRFQEELPEDLTIEQLRGKEGVRVRKTYAEQSQRSGVSWKGRDYSRNSWANSNPVNRALSSANSALYGVVHAAIVAMGLSPGLGFIHTGKQLSFVYDIADLYKTETTIPAAFDAAAHTPGSVEGTVRRFLRDRFQETRILERIALDLRELMSIEGVEDSLFDVDEAAPGSLWDESGVVGGGKNYGGNSA